MVDSLLSFGVEKLWDLLVRESERFQVVGEQFNELKSDLNMLRSFLEDADAKKHTSSMVRNTVKEIKEIVYDAEDVIETFVLKEELGRKSVIKKLACVLAHRREIALDMELLHKRIAKVIRDMQSLGVQQVIVSDGYMQSLQERQRQMRQTFSDNNESVLVGLEENVKKLVGHLVEEDGSQVVSITGMGGIGKTTLARQVFNHETVKSHFAGQAWVCVSQQFKRKDVWQMILRKVEPEYFKSEMTENELQEKLFLVLKARKALIVLDDIWREDDWDIIKPIFPLGRGWKVLFTSRNEGVALRADPNCFTLKPDCLTFEESWTIFRRIVFPRENTAEMEELGKKIVKHCGGLPLAVKVLGGLLVEQYTLDEWKRIYADIRSHIVGETNFSDKISPIYHILSLGFEELPIYLKHCFLYLAQFPEDFEIEVEQLSCLWAAEGITRPSFNDGATFREVADGYIKELVNRNMVIISDRDTGISRFEMCHMHDMMREVCLHKAEEENFVHIVGIADSQPPCKSRRIAVHKTYQLKWEMQNPKLRSILFIIDSPGQGWMASGVCFKRLQLMRILDLSEAKFKGGKLPFDIGKLIHLRYLNLCLAEVTHLPSSMRNLKLLRYLNLLVLVASPVYVPNFMKEMRELTYLYLPREMHDKTKLELGNLVNLETLENFSIKHSSVNDLQRMTRLRNLSINNHCLEEDLMPILEKLPQLKEVILENYAGKKMVCSGGGFPQLKKLEFLALKEWEEWIVEEGSMPLLHTLNILDCTKLKKLPNGGFPQLNRLELKGLEKWEEWIVEEGSMPLLLYLTIEKCPKLKKFPNGGFPQLHTLVFDALEEWEEWLVEEGSMPLLHKLSIWNCPKLKRFPNGGFPQLHTLVFGALEECEEWIVEEGSMPLLHTLYFWSCPKLKKLPNGGFPQLHTLVFGALYDLEEWIVEEGYMPLLHTLTILNCPKLKKFPNGGFPQLHKLSIGGLEEWKEWIVEEGSMPLLHTLKIWRCPKLKEVPEGLRFLYSLKHLSIYKEWKERLSEGGEDYYKVKHIPSIDFQEDEEE